MRVVGRAGCVAVLGGLLSVGAMAQGPQQPGTAGQTTSGGKVSRSMSDEEFLNRAIMGNHTAIDAANLALRQSSNAQVKEAAQTIVGAHTAMLQRLQEVARTMGWKYDDTAGPVGKRMIGQLQGLSGAAFDQGFFKAMIQLHQREAGMYEAEAGNGQNEPVMKVAGDQLPEIQHHLQELESVQKSGLKG